MLLSNGRNDLILLRLLLHCWIGLDSVNAVLLIEKLPLPCRVLRSANVGPKLVVQLIAILGVDEQINFVDPNIGRLWHPVTVKECEIVFVLELGGQALVSSSAVQKRLLFNEILLRLALPL